jgi:hypothetical protein
VRALLAGLKADPANGIDRIIERDEVAKLGGDGDADFYVNLGEGMAATGYLRPGLPLRFPSPYRGCTAISPMIRAWPQPSSSRGRASRRAAIWAGSTCAPSPPRWKRS